MSELCSQQRFELPGGRMEREDEVFMEALPSNSLGIALLPGRSPLIAALCFAGSGWKCPSLEENVTCGCNSGSAAAALSLLSPRLPFRFPQRLRTPHPCPVSHVGCEDRVPPTQSPHHRGLQVTSAVW